MKKIRELIFDATMTIRVTDKMHDVIDVMAANEVRTLSSMAKILLSEALANRAEKTENFRWDKGEL